MWSVVTSMVKLFTDAWMTLSRGTLWSTPAVTSPGGDSFLLLSNGTDFLLLSDGSSKLIIA